MKGTNFGGILMLWTLAAVAWPETSSQQIYRCEVPRLDQEFCNAFHSVCISSESKLCLAQSMANCLNNTGFSVSILASLRDYINNFIKSISSPPAPVVKPPTPIFPPFPTLPIGPPPEPFKPQPPLVLPPMPTIPEPINPQPPMVLPPMPTIPEPLNPQPPLVLPPVPTMPTMPEPFNPKPPQIVLPSIPAPQPTLPQPEPIKPIVIRPLPVHPPVTMPPLPPLPPITAAPQPSPIPPTIYTDQSYIDYLIMVLEYMQTVQMERIIQVPSFLTSYTWQVKTSPQDVEALLAKLFYLLNSYSTYQLDFLALETRLRPVLLWSSEIFEWFSTVVEQIYAALNLNFPTLYVEPNIIVGYYGIYETTLASRRDDIKMCHTDPREDDCEVYCTDSYGGNWIGIQARERDGSMVSFNRPLSEYIAGFGGWDSGYWMGLGCLNAITENNPHELLVELTDASGKTAIAHYDRFWIGDASTGYQLHLGQFLGGAAGDALRISDGCQFTTRDYDADEYLGNCAIKHEGAWWYKNCQKPHVKNFLNGYFSSDPNKNDLSANYPFFGVRWSTWQTEYVIAATRIFIRRPLTTYDSIFFGSSGLSAGATDGTASGFYTGSQVSTKPLFGSSGYDGAVNTGYMGSSGFDTGVSSGMFMGSSGFDSGVSSGGYLGSTGFDAGVSSGGFMGSSGFDSGVNPGVQYAGTVVGSPIILEGSLTGDSVSGLDETGYEVYETDGFDLAHQMT